MLKSINANVSKFDALELPSIPKRNAESIKEFIEGISSFSMLSLSGKRLPPVPQGTRIFSDITLEGAYAKAHKGWTFDYLLRRSTFRKNPIPNSLLDDGSAAIKLISTIHHRFPDTRLAMQTAYSITVDELSRKMDFSGAEHLIIGIPFSAAFAVGLKAIEDIDFTDKKLFIAHAAERWKLIEDGFSIYAYSGTTPYVFYEKGDGDSGRFGSSIGPLSFV